MALQDMNQCMCKVSGKRDTEVAKGWSLAALGLSPGTPWTP